VVTQSVSKCEDLIAPYGQHLRLHRQAELQQRMSCHGLTLNVPTPRPVYGEWTVPETSCLTYSSICNYGDTAVIIFCFKFIQLRPKYKWKDNIKIQCTPD
jgi:hypothetical protein